MQLWKKKDNSDQDKNQAAKEKPQIRYRWTTKLVIAVLIVALIISPIGFSPPREAEAVAPVILLAVGCGLGSLTTFFFDWMENDWPSSAAEWTAEAVGGCSIGILTEAVAILVVTTGLGWSGAVAVIAEVLFGITWHIDIEGLAPYLVDRYYSFLTGVFEGLYNPDGLATITSSSIRDDIKNSPDIQYVANDLLSDLEFGTGI